MKNKLTRKSDRTIRIGKHKIGPGERTYIIFEVASTHSNDWKIAEQYVRDAARIGADAVKFQLFTAEGILNPLTPGLKGTYDYFTTAETPREWFPKLVKLSRALGIDLLCSPFSLDAASYLDKVGIPAVKIASGELTNIQLLEHVATFGKPVILSTGMATMDEIRAAVSTLRSGGVKDLVILQCVSVYPTNFKDANVSAMDALAREFSVQVGYSDNGSAGILVPLMAVAKGATVIEKHVTFAVKKRKGNLDDKFSLTVSEFADMVKQIRKIDEAKDKGKVLKRLEAKYGKKFRDAIGDGIKRPAIHGTWKTHPGSGRFLQKEGDERRWARRGIFPARDIPKGTLVTADMLVSLRPDIGISSVQFRDVVGKVAGESLKAKMPIKFSGGKIANFRKSDITTTYNNPDDEQFARMLSEGAIFE